MLRVGYAMSGAEVGFAATSRYCDGSGRDGVHEGGGWKPWHVLKPSMMLCAPVYFYAALGTEAGNMAVPGSSFVPAAEKDTMIALYGQIRFWFAQYWDVKADFDKVAFYAFNAAGQLSFCSTISGTDRARAATRVKNNVCIGA
eukprot:1633928-Rhodomonas_salina.4